ncbi:hypothetical protein [Planctomicrobium sp. SH664]|uniref:hypothetical protein n=1 Tax=Planctomicrobium sp. SH664 TaxID=3448125 RepID=UPI003F5B6FDA
MQDPEQGSTANTEQGEEFVLLPRPTAAPLVVALGVALLALGVPFGVAFAGVGGVLLFVGLRSWIADLGRGAGEVLEPLRAAEFRATPIQPAPGTVAELKPGVPGYRFRLPERVHPLSAGVRGGIIGGLVMPVPALLHGILSGHGIWYPVNLLAGIMLPGMQRLDVAQLEQFRPGALVAGLMVHAVICLIAGLIYGAVLPTLPRLPKPIAWGWLLLPLLWSSVSYGLMGFVNPLLSREVDWPWYVFSQFLYGLSVAVVVWLLPRWKPVASGTLGGLIGGLVMPVPAIAWALISERTIWYPGNLLVAMVQPALQSLSPAELQEFRLDWIAIAVGVHFAMSTIFGMLFGLFLPRVPRLPTTWQWGGLVLPLLWTGMSYGLMGVVNPLLQTRVDWPWFIASQFVFGVVTAIVVELSETVSIPPAGLGPEADQAAAVDWIQE